MLTNRFIVFRTAGLGEFLVSKVVVGAMDQPCIAGDVAPYNTGRSVGRMQNTVLPLTLDRNRVL